jgi:hypothetical protein
VDKYVGSGTTSPAWDSTPPLVHRCFLMLTEPANVDPFASAVASYNNSQDSLPPFTSLSTEEDWQRKAEHRPPGTYYVVANSSSFSDVEEYRQRDDDSRRSSGPSGSRPDLKVPTLFICAGSWLTESSLIREARTCLSIQRRSSLELSRTTPDAHLCYPRTLLEGVQTAPEATSHSQVH